MESTSHKLNERLIFAENGIQDGQKCSEKTLKCQIVREDSESKHTGFGIKAVVDTYHTGSNSEHLINILGMPNVDISDEIYVPNDIAESLGERDKREVFKDVLSQKTKGKSLLRFDKEHAEYPGGRIHSALLNLQEETRQESAINARYRRAAKQKRKCKQDPSKCNKRGNNGSRRSKNKPKKLLKFQIAHKDQQPPIHLKDPSTAVVDEAGTYFVYASALVRSKSVDTYIEIEFKDQQGTLKERSISQNGVDIGVNVGVTRESQSKTCTLHGLVSLDVSDSIRLYVNNDESTKFETFGSLNVA
ncbi:hypothetical protein MAR_013223 [Mya arenaria]|uniref:Uncharacterized protein n=1 Tax=Mya arenaria TaxID=6604 RepID=A0ABY7G298_MYAAR|nr:hypothetical protein MAR_013223 [Mya arenaria]